MFIIFCTSFKETCGNWASVKEISGSSCCDPIAIIVVDHLPGLQMFATSCRFIMTGRCSSSSGLYAGYLLNGLVWHLLGKAVIGRLSIGLIDEEVVDVLGCIGIFDVFCDSFGSGHGPSVFSHVFAIDCWWRDAVIPGVPQSLSSVTAFFRALNLDCGFPFHLVRKV